MNQQAHTPRGGKAEYIANALREMIFSGELQPGQPLRQSKLAQQLGISRIPLREAFQLLAAEGLVSLHSNRGASVTGLTAHEIQQCQEIRVQLETWLLELSMPLILPEDIEKAGVFLGLMDDCSDAEWSSLNLEFHCALYAPANRDYIIQMLRKLYIGSYRRFHQPILGSRNRAKMQREHAELLNLCKDGDVQTAIDRLEAHILLNGRAVLDRVKAMENRLEQPRPAQKGQA